jgi:hypothetical protein
MHIMPLVGDVASVVTILAFAWSIREGFTFRRMVRAMFVHDLRAMVDQVDAIKADADPATGGKLELVQGSLERLRNKMIDVFSIKGAQKNGP